MTDEVRVADLLRLPTLAGTTVVAGAAGLDRTIRNVSVVAGTEITQWVKPGAALLSTGHPIRERVGTLPQIVRELDERSVSCIAVRLGAYLDEFPDELLRSADELGLPVIRLTDQFAFDDILIDILKRINSALLADRELAEEVHVALTDLVMNGGNAARVAREASRLLRAEVSLYDATGVLLTPPGSDEIPPRDWRRFESVARDARHRNLPVDSLILHLGGPSAPFGYLQATRPGAPFSPSEVRALERSATVAALAMAQEATVREVEAHYQGEILTQLLRGELHQLDSAVTRFREVGWQLRPPLLVAAVQTWDGAHGQPHDPRGELWLRSTGLHLLRESLGRPSDSPVTGMVGRSLVAMIPVGLRDQLMRGLRRVNDGFPRRAGEELDVRISAGISGECAELTEGPRALRQAEVAAHAARRQPASAGPCRFDQLGALGVVLAGTLDRESPDVIDQVLRPIDQIPRRDARTLLDTLQVLVEKNMSLADGARVLGCHYNTMRHRVRRLEELLGPFTRDADLRLNIAIALRLRDFAGHVG
jgi:purine catabolism regulator